MRDPLKGYVPEFKRQLAEGDDLFIEMQDLLADFDHPAFVMDCKIGVRTYLEDEVKKNAKPREVNIFQCFFTFAKILPKHFSGLSSLYENSFYQKTLIYDSNFFFFFRLGFVYENDRC